MIAHPTLQLPVHGLRLEPVIGRGSRAGAIIPLPCAAAPRERMIIRGRCVALFNVVHTLRRRRLRAYGGLQLQLLLARRRRLW